jgi:RimJ/RimL family protein N-acetyltransferase
MPTSEEATGLSVSDGNSPVIETARLSLREMTGDDAPFMRAILNDPDFIRYIGDRGVRTVAEARSYLHERVLASYREHGYGMYAVERSADAVAVGICGLVRRETLPAPDIGFAFLPAYRNSGYARESAAAVLRYASEVLKLPRVIAIATPDNEPSNVLLQRLGMHLGQVVRLAGDDTDLNLYEHHAPH